MLAKREEDFSEYLSSRAVFRGFTALHYAVLADCKACIKALLDGGADPTVENDLGFRALEYSKNEEIKKLLIDHALIYDELMKEKVRFFDSKCLKY